MTAWFYSLSIRGKLSALILAASVLLLVLISTALIANEFIRLKDNLSSDLSTLTEIMGTNSGIGLAFDDAKASQDVLKSLAAKPNIVYAQVFDLKGKNFARYDRAGSVPVPTENVLYGADADLFKMDQDNNIEIKHHFVFHARLNYALALKEITQDGRLLGGILIRSDLSEIKFRLLLYISTVFIVMLVSLVLTLLITSRLQNIITTPVYRLRDTIQQISTNKNYTLRVEKLGNDEIGQLIDGFNGMLVKIEESDHEIRSLNALLQEENQRMGAELEVTRRLQQMVLPTAQELQAVIGLDIAGYMDPADEVGGDYYDVLCHGTSIKIGIGDVTGHGLESGVVMMMVQMAVRTLLASSITDPKMFLTVINKALFANVQRMKTDKNLTLSLLDYEADGSLRFTGQHEEVLVIRHNATIERIDTINLGFMVGLLPDISRFVGYAETHLDIGEGIVLYTDGITEARDDSETLYGLDRLCEVISQHWQMTATQIQQAIIHDVRQFTGSQKILDDMTLLVLKRLN
jgi:serine phosphatase RsbU (regulator of sigma subunit)